MLAISGEFSTEDESDLDVNCISSYTTEAARQVALVASQVINDALEVICEVQTATGAIISVGSSFSALGSQVGMCVNPFNSHAPYYRAVIF